MWWPASCTPPGNAPEPLSAERKSTWVKPRQIRNFNNVAYCNGKEFDGSKDELLEMFDALNQALRRLGDVKFGL